MDKPKESNAVSNCISPPSSQKKMQQNITGAVSLNEDIFFEVLARLHGIILHKNARFVCRSWAAMIGTSQFAEEHLRRAKPGLFIQNTRPPYGASFIELMENDMFSLMYLQPKNPGRILNSCDGLVLFLQYTTKVLHVGNPVTQQVTRIPDLPAGGKPMNPPCAIARVPRDGEFKLFGATVQNNSGDFVGHWYVLRLGIDHSWRNIYTESGHFEFACNPIYNGGSDLYWITEDKVIVMDVDKETFRAFTIPQELRQHPQYLKMGDCLSSIIYLEQGFQVHTFDAESGKWTLYHQIGHLNYPTNIGHQVLSEFFCAWLDQELIIKPTVLPSMATIIFCYNVKTKALKMVSGRQSWGSFELELHTISLLSWKNALPVGEGSTTAVGS